MSNPENVTEEAGEDSGESYEDLPGLGYQTRHSLNEEDSQELGRGRRGTLTGRRADGRGRGRGRRGREDSGESEDLPDFGFQTRHSLNEDDSQELVRGRRGTMTGRRADGRGRGRGRRGREDSGESEDLPDFGFQTRHSLNEDDSQELVRGRRGTMTGRRADGRGRGRGRRGRGTERGNMFRDNSSNGETSASDIGGNGADFMPRILARSNRTVSTVRMGANREHGGVGIRERREGYDGGGELEGRGGQHSGRRGLGRGLRMEGRGRGSGLDLEVSEVVLGNREGGRGGRGGRGNSEHGDTGDGEERENGEEYEAVGDDMDYTEDEHSSKNKTRPDMLVPG